MTATTETQPKLLTQREQRNLEKLVAEDFDKAERGLRAQAEAWERETKDHITAEHQPDPSVVAMLDRKAGELEAELREKIATFVAEAAELGYAPAARYASIIGGNVTVARTYERAGLTQALAKAHDDAYRSEDAARRALQDARADARRRILLATLEQGSAQDMLASIPTADDTYRAAITSRVS